MPGPNRSSSQELAQQSRGRLGGIKVQHVTGIRDHFMAVVGEAVQSGLAQVCGRGEHER